VKTNFKIQLIPHEEMDTILPLVFLLNKETIPLVTLQKRLIEMLKMDNYECIGVYDEKELIGICGVWILNKLYAGKHAEPDNVFIKEAYRSQGVGELLLNWFFDYAKKMECEGAEVNFYVANEKGKKFWESQGFQPLAHHGFKTLNKENE